MTTYHADDLDRGHDFSEATLWTEFASNDLIVLLCDNRPVGLCVLLSAYFGATWPVISLERDRPFRINVTGHFV